MRKATLLVLLLFCSLGANDAHAFKVPKFIKNLFSETPPKHPEVPASRHHDVPPQANDAWQAPPTGSSGPNGFDYFVQMGVANNAFKKMISRKDRSSDSCSTPPKRKIISQEADVFLEPNLANGKIGRFEADETLCVTHEMDDWYRTDYGWVQKIHFQTESAPQSSGPIPQSDDFVRFIEEERRRVEQQQIR